MSDTGNMPPPPPRAGFKHNFSRSALPEPQQHQKNQSKITVMGYQCTGLTGEGAARQDIFPRSFESLFSACDDIRIPIFQRTYCWTDDQFSKWWRDVKRAGADGPGADGNVHGHGVGKAVYVHNGARTRADPLMCVDGQQRMTTAMLLLAAVRDSALMLTDRALPQHRQQYQLVVDKIDAVLFSDVQRMREWVQAAAQKIQNGPRGTAEHVYRWADCCAEGKVLSFARLRPSFIDRSAFFHEILCAHVARVAGGSDSNIQGNIGSDIGSGPPATRQRHAKLFFDARLREHVADATECSPTSLHGLAQRQLRGLYLMYVEILDEVRLPQVFQWLQEKSLVGMGALLYNPSKGVNFGAIDMLRNTLLATFSDEGGDSEEEATYRRLWLTPLEMRVRAGLRRSATGHTHAAEATTLKRDGAAALRRRPPMGASTVIREGEGESDADAGAATGAGGGGGGGGGSGSFIQAGESYAFISKANEAVADEMAEAAKEGRRRDSSAGKKPKMAQRRGGPPAATAAAAAGASVEAGSVSMDDVFGSYLDAWDRGEAGHRPPGSPGLKPGVGAKTGAEANAGAGARGEVLPLEARQQAQQARAEEVEWARFGFVPGRWVGDAERTLLGMFASMAKHMPAMLMQVEANLGPVYLFGRFHSCFEAMQAHEEAQFQRAGRVYSDSDVRASAAEALLVEIAMHVDKYFEPV